MFPQQIEKSISPNRHANLQHKTSEQIMQFTCSYSLLFHAYSLDLLQHQIGTKGISLTLPEMSVICLPRKPRQPTKLLQACPVLSAYFHCCLGPDFFLIGMLNRSSAISIIASNSFVCSSAARSSF